MAQLSRRTSSLAVGMLVAGTCLLGGTRSASADASPKAEVMVIHATKCSEKSVDPSIGDAPPLGYDCMKLLDKKTMPLSLNQSSTTPLPNGRVFQLVYAGKVDSRFKVTASISPADGSAGFVKLADITAEPSKPFNVGGFSYKGGVLLLKVRIVP